MLIGSTSIVALGSAPTESEPVVGVTKTVLTVGLAGLAEFTDLTVALVRRVGVVGAGFVTVPLPPTLWPRTTEDVPNDKASVMAKITKSGILTVCNGRETSSLQTVNGRRASDVLRISQPPVQHESVS
jgi:hypothetical protein